MRRRLHSNFDYYRYVYADVTGVLGGLLMLLLTFIVLPEPWFTVMLAATTVVTAFALIKQTFGVYRNWTGVRFQRNRVTGLSRFASPGSGRKARAQKAVAWRSASPRLEMLCNAPRGLQTEVWFDEAVDAELLKHSEVTMSAQETSDDPVTVPSLLSEQSFALPGALASMAPAALRFDRTSTDLILDPHKKRIPIRFNGRLLRLATEPTVETLRGGECRLEPVRYFDGEASNELWRFRSVDPTDTAVSVDDGFDSPVKNYVLDRSGSIKQLEHAEAANIVGISVMAMTADEQLVFVRQTAQNSIAPQALAASGSGSLELRDFDEALLGGVKAVLPEVSVRERTTLKERKALVQAAKNETEIPLVMVLLRGMLREMSEESGVGASTIIAESARVTSYFRWVERVMKPEFVGIVRLNINADELPLSPNWKLERAFTKGTYTIGFAEVAKQLAAGSPEVPGFEYSRIGQALNGALLNGFEEEHRDLGRAFMSPSCEHAAVTAISYLGTEDGKNWITEYSSRNPAVGN